MKRGIITMKKWYEYLPGDVYMRLCNCRSRRDDLQTLVNCKWYAMKEAGKDKAGFTKEDALVQILDLLDMNGQFCDISRAEYDALKSE